MIYRYAYSLCKDGNTYRSFTGTDIFNPLGTVFLLYFFSFSLVYFFPFFEFKVIQSNEIHRLKTSSIIKHSFLNTHGMHHVTL